MRHRDEDSLHSVAKLRRLPITDERVQLEHKGILAEVRMQDEVLKREHPRLIGKSIALEAVSWLDLFKPRYLKRTIISIAIPFFQQFSGINAFVYVSSFPPLHHFCF